MNKQLIINAIFENICEQNHKYPAKIEVSARAPTLEMMKISGILNIGELADAILNVTTNKQTQTTGFAAPVNIRPVRLTITRDNLKGITPASVRGMNLVGVDLVGVSLIELQQNYLELFHALKNTMYTTKGDFKEI